MQRLTQTKATQRYGNMAQFQDLLAVAGCRATVLGPLVQGDGGEPYIPRRDDMCADLQGDANSRETEAELEKPERICERGVAFVRYPELVAAAAAF